MVPKCLDGSPATYLARSIAIADTGTDTIANISAVAVCTATHLVNIGLAEG